MSDNLSQSSQSIAAHQATFTQSIEGTKETADKLDVTVAASKMASQEKLASEGEDFSSYGLVIKSQKLPKRPEVKSEKAARAKESVLVRKDDADGLAGEFSQRQGNREYHLDPHALSVLAAEELGEGINPETSPDEVITIIRKRMSFQGQAPDVSIVDKTFEFLLEVTESQLKTANENDKPRIKAIHEKLETAKFKHFDSHAVEIQVAQKIIGAVDAVVEHTGKAVKETLDRYRDVVHNPPDIQALRKFYESKGGYKTMIPEFKGLNTYLGGNLKRTNLESPELAQLAGATRKMQAMLGVFQQAEKQRKTAESFLTLNGILIAAAA